MENGTKEGHQILMEARHTLLKVLPVDEKSDGEKYILLTLAVDK